MAPNRLPSVTACPPKLEGWTPLANFTLAKINDKAPQILAKGLPQGSLCQREESNAVSYYVRNDRNAFVDLLLLPPKQGLLQSPSISDDALSVAIALIAARRHPGAQDAQQFTVLEKTPPPLVDTENAGIDWSVVDAGLTPALVTLIRFEMQDYDNELFRQAQHGDAYYVTHDTEKLLRIVATLQEVKRDLTAVGQQEAADEVNHAAVQLTFIQTTQESKLPFYKRHMKEIILVALATYFGGLAVGAGFHDAVPLANYRNIAIKRVYQWMRDFFRGPGSGGAGASGGSVSASPVASPPAAVEFSSLDDRVDAGEVADFQIDPTRAYDPLQHIHINGTAVAAVVIIGGVALLVPVVIPYVAVVSPEAVSLATGVGVFAASH